MFFSTILLAIWAIQGLELNDFVEDSVADAPTCEGVMKEKTQDNFYKICGWEDNKCEVAAVTNMGTCREFCTSNALECVDGQDNLDGCKRNTNTYNSCDRKLQNQVCVCSAVPRNDDNECNEFNFSALFYKTSDECKSGMRKGVTKESVCKCDSDFPENRGFETFDCFLSLDKPADGMGEFNPKQAFAYVGSCPAPKAKKDCESCVLEFFNNGGCTAKDPLSVVPEGCMHCGENAEEVCEHFHPDEEENEENEQTEPAAEEASTEDIQEVNVGQAEEEAENTCGGMMRPKTKENYYRVCEEQENQCEVAAVTNKGTCREFCTSNGLECVDGQDNLDGCKRNTNTYNSCDRKLQNQVCVCARLPRTDDGQCNEFNFSALFYETTAECKAGVMKGLTKESVCKCHADFPKTRGFDTFDCVLSLDKPGVGIGEMNPKQILAYTGGCPAPKEAKTCDECVLDFFNNGGCTASDPLSVVPEGCMRCGDAADEVCKAFKEDGSAAMKALTDSGPDNLMSMSFEYAVGEGEGESESEGEGESESEGGEASPTKKKQNNCGGMMKAKTDENYYKVCGMKEDQCEVAAVTNKGTCAEFCTSNGLSCVDGQDNEEGCIRKSSTFRSCHRKLKNQICVCSATPKPDDGECNEFNFSGAFAKASQECQDSIKDGLSKKSLCKCKAGFPEDRPLESFDCTLNFGRNAGLNPKQALAYVGKCPTEENTSSEDKDCEQCVLEFFNAGGCTAEDPWDLIPDGCMSCGVEAAEVCEHFDNEEDDDAEEVEEVTKEEGKEESTEDAQTEGEGKEEEKKNEASIGSLEQQQIWTATKYFLFLTFVGLIAYYLGQQIGRKKREQNYMSFRDTEMSAGIYAEQE